MKHLGTLGVTVAFLLIAVGAPAWAAGADSYWPTWRGPAATGTAAQGNPPVTWSESENIKWKVEIPGKGHSSPVIWGDKLFLQTAIDTGQAKAAEMQPAQPPAAAKGGRGGMSTPTPKTVHKFDLLCLDRSTGKILWEKTAIEAVPHEGHQPTGTFASYSPVTDGKYIWASFGSRGLYCYDLEGNLKWSKPLPTMKTIMSFGEGSSPALAGDAIIVVCDQEAGSAIFAFNKTTGEQLWRKDRDERTSWATPAVVRGGRQDPGHRQRHQAHSQLRRQDRRPHLAVRRPGAERHSEPGPRLRHGLLHQRLPGGLPPGHQAGRQDRGPQRDRRHRLAGQQGNALCLLAPALRQPDLRLLRPHAEICPATRPRPANPCSPSRPWRGSTRSTRRPWASPTAYTAPAATA